MNGRLTSLRHSARGQADAGTIIILASLCAAVFACFFLIGRAASPHAQSAEPPPPAIGAVVAGLPLRMGSAPAIAADISATRVPSRRRVVSGTPTVAAASAPSVLQISNSSSSAPTRATPTKIAPTEVTPPTSATPRPTATTPASKAPASTGGPGTSFDTSG